MQKPRFDWLQYSRQSKTNLSFGIHTFVTKHLSQIVPSVLDRERSFSIEEVCYSSCDITAVLLHVLQIHVHFGRGHPSLRDNCKIASRVRLQKVMAEWRREQKWISTKSSPHAYSWFNWDFAPGKNGGLITASSTHCNRFFFDIGIKVWMGYDIGSKMPVVTFTVSDLTLYLRCLRCHC
jgi:hypothetical protein